jgi:molybdopterin-guanine dinucleotide biosynthesis protein A
MSAPLHVVVLAAGEGKRMKSALPKVLQKVAGRPMLAHVIDAARALAPQGIHVVYGHGGEAVRAAFADQPDLHWAEQVQQLGTGHAVQQAMPGVPDDVRVLVLYGDVPLITAHSLRRLMDAPGRLAVLAAELPIRPATAASCAILKAAWHRSSSRRTRTRSSAGSAWSTPASSPPTPPRSSAGWSTWATTTRRASTT